MGDHTGAMARSTSPPLRVRVLALIGAFLCLGIIATTAAPAAAAPTTVAVAGAATGTLSGFLVQTVADPSATNGSAVRYQWSGSVQLTVTLPADADGVTLRVRGDQCAGAPAYTLTIDNAPVGNSSIASTSWTTNTYSVSLVAGAHVIQVAFANPQVQYWPAFCDRTLYLDSATFTSSGALATNPSIPAGFVHQAGTSLLDGAGRPIRLHGVNIGGWLEWQGWIWGEGFDYIGESAMMQNLTSLVGSTQAQQFQTDVYENGLTPSDFHAMSVHGFNVVRVPFNYRLLEDDAHPFVYKQAGWDVLDRIIEEAKQANVYVILDMAVAPCSQMYAFISDYVGGPYLWSLQQCQDRMVAMWKAIAARYANENAIAGYDLLNETIVSDAQLLALYQRVTAAIRQVDRSHLLIYEGNDMARTFTMLTQPLDSNEMLSFHDYPWAFTGQDFSVRLAEFDAVAKRLNAPLYAGEFGESTYSNAQKYVADLNNDPLVAAWTYWTWKQHGGFSESQNIQESAAAQKLIDWINNTSRPQPTAAEAAQGMSDFINEVRFENTLPDAYLVDILSAPMPTGPAPALTAPAAPNVITTSPSQSAAARAGRTSGRRMPARCRNVALASRTSSRKRHVAVGKPRCGLSGPTHRAPHKHRARRRS